MKINFYAKNGVIMKVKSLDDWKKLKGERKRSGNMSSGRFADSDIDAHSNRREFLRTLVFGGLTAAAGLGVYAAGVHAYENHVIDGYRKSAEKFDAKIAQIQEKLNLKVRIRDLESKMVELANENTDLKAGRHKEIEQLESQIEDIYNREKTNPAKFSLGAGSEVLDVAKTIFCEASEYFRHDKYLSNVGTTPIVRAALTGSDVADVINAKISDKDGVRYAYSFMNPNDKMYKFMLNPLRNSDKAPLDLDAWNSSFDMARYLLSIPADEIDPLLTHFYVDTVKQPDWAKDEKAVDTIILNGKTTRFYYIPEDFKKA